MILVVSTHEYRPNKKPLLIDLSHRGQIRNYKYTIEPLMEVFQKDADEYCSSLWHSKITSCRTQCQKCSIETTVTDGRLGKIHLI